MDGVGHGARPTAVVTGASRGFGRSIAEALVGAGAKVVGVARESVDLREVEHRLGSDFVAVAGDATDPELARQVLAAHRPDALVLNAGAHPPMGHLTDLSWQEFSTNWQTDTRHVFIWVQSALALPLDPGSTVLVMGSGASQSGSPLSGGYAGAKATARFIAGYASGESNDRGLGVSFFTLMPQLTPLTGLGAEAVQAYGKSAGGTDVVLEGLRPHLTPERVGAVVARLVGIGDPTPVVSDEWPPGPPAPGSYLLTGSRIASLS